MPFYLSSYIGAGTLEDPCRPRGSEQPGWSAIDLRPDGGATPDGGGLNLCLLHLPLHDPDTRLYQFGLDKHEELGPAVRNGLRSRLGIDDAGFTRLDEVIAAALLNPPANRWKRLRGCGRWRTPGRLGGVYRIWLGGLLWEAPIIAGGASYTETWTAGDSANLDADLDWTEFSTAKNWAISSNKARLANTATGTNAARAEHDLAADDMEVSCQIVGYTVGGAFNVIAVTARKDSTNTQTHYSFWHLGHGAGNDQHELYKTVDGTETRLGSIDSTALTLNEVIKVKCDGDQITGLIDGAISVGPVTDTAISGNTRAGFSGFINHTSGVREIDNWAAADLSTGQTIAVNQVTETDLAQAVTVNPQRRLITQTTEADLAQAVTVNPQRRLVAQVSEADLAQSVTLPGQQTVPVNPVTETDLAQPISWAPKHRLVGAAAETETAQPLTVHKLRTLGIPIETDLAQALARSKAKGIGQATELDLAQTILWAPKVRLVGQALEADLAQALTAVMGERLRNVVYVVAEVSPEIQRTVTCGITVPRTVQV